MAAAGGQSRGHVLALGVLAGIIVLWAGLMAFALVEAALPTHEHGVVVVVFPPGFGDKTAVFHAVVAAGGRPLRGSWFGNVWTVSGDDPGFVGRLKTAGAWGAFAPGVFSPVSLGGCFSAPLPPAS